MIKLSKIGFTLGVAVLVSSCASKVAFQNKDLYDIASDDTLIPQINGFKAINVFEDDYDKSVWVSPESQCVTLKLQEEKVFSGKAALHVKWDKIAGGCSWIGMGIGWNNWMAKDIVDIVHDSAIQFQVKAENGSFSNLPVAFAFEDYSGVQAYYGFTKELANGTFNDKSWTTVRIPLTKFEFASHNFDLEKVKQFMIQLEGDGDIYIDQIKFVQLQQ